MERPVLDAPNPKINGLSGIRPGPILMVVDGALAPSDPLPHILEKTTEIHFESRNPGRNVSEPNEGNESHVVFTGVDSHDAMSICSPKIGDKRNMPRAFPDTNVV